MAFGQGSRHSVAFGVESTFGQTPGAPTTTLVRNTGSGLVLSKETFVSEELRSDRQITFSRHGNRQVGGPINFELHYGGLDDILESLMFSTWATNVLKAGTTLKSLFIERRFEDISQYLLYNGCVANTLNLDIAAGRPVTGSLGFVGSDLTVSGTEVATPSAAPTGEPFTAFEAALQEGGASIATVTAVNLSLTDGIEPNFVVGSDVTPQLSYGRSNLTGTLTAFFEDASLINKFINETATDLKITLTDTGSSVLDIFAPNITYGGADNPVNGEGSILITLPFQAKYDVTDASNLVFTRTP